MTTLSSKLHDVTKQLQQLTVWRPNEHDPFIELHRWRDTAHQLIEEFYRNKRDEIENLMEKHQRDFMKQIARQRLLVESLRQRIVTISNQNNAHLRIQSETSILTDLQKIERDISTKLGRGEIRVESKPIQLDDLVIIHLKTYLANTATVYHDEKAHRMGSSNQRRVRPSTEENVQAYQNWLRTKTPTKEKIALDRQVKKQAEEERLVWLREKQRGFDEWVQRKREIGAFRKKKTTIDDPMNLNKTHLLSETLPS